MKKVENLEQAIKHKDNKIEELENKVNHLEQYTKRNNVIIHGLRLTKLKNYAQAVTGITEEQVTLDTTELPTIPPKSTQPTEREKLQNTKTQLLNFFSHSLGVSLSDTEIGAAYELSPADGKDGPPPIIVRFISSAAKKDIMMARRKAQNIYIN